MQADNQLITNLDKIIQSNVAQGFPFALYRLPNTQTVNLIAQSNSQNRNPNNLSDFNGYIVAPFVEDEQHRTWHIQPDIIEEFELPMLRQAQHDTTHNPHPLNPNPKDSQSQFTNHVNNILQEIEANTFQKAIAWRIVDTPKPKDFSLASTFLKLCHQYSYAYVSLVFIPDNGIWIGASPELLLNLKNDTVSTVALAGTKPINSNREFTNKEVEEQSMVTQHIKQVIGKYTKSLSISKPKTINAGTVSHLKTEFTGTSFDLNNLEKVLKELHPTPAVGGLPVKQALDWIKTKEKKSRSYYCGYQGVVNTSNTTSLYVNLRCLKVLEDTLQIYTGCGITAGSVPEDEWQETQHKAATLLNVL